jgi:hypothetical protein
MTREERRVQEFSSGLANLGGQSRDYLQNLTHAMFFIERIEKTPGSPLAGAGNAAAPGKTPDRGRDSPPRGGKNTRHGGEDNGC